jgi:hypothetical protein
LRYCQLLYASSMYINLNTLFLLPLFLSIFKSYYLIFK